MTSPHDGVLQIGCEGCVMAATSACEDCLVTFLCADDEPAAPRAVVLDLEEHRAVRRMQAVGLLPASRFRARSG